MATSLRRDDSGFWAEQAPGALLDYTLDWADDWDGTDAIASSEWSAAPGIVLSDRSFTDTTATCWLSGGIAGASYAITNRITTASGRTDQRTFRLFVRDEGAAPGVASVFPSLPEAVARLRRDRLLGPAQTYLAGLELSDEYLMGKLLAAEREMERRLRVFLTPTEVLPSGATQEERDALDQAGTRWVEEPGYDHDALLMGGDAWGLIELRHRPVIAVHSIRFAYPSLQATTFEVPPEWIRIDKKYGKLQLVPVMFAGAMNFSGVVLAQLNAGRTVPFAIQVRYRVGIANAAREVPDALQIIQRMAVLDVLDDQILPASGSTSVDGLSQSVSWEGSKHRDLLDRQIDALRQSLQGIRLVVC